MQRASAGRGGVRAGGGVVPGGPPQGPVLQGQDEDGLHPQADRPHCGGGEGELLGAVPASDGGGGGTS